MNDRELLELAAKAAGYCVNPNGRTDGAFVVLSNDEGDFIWNPLTDDGDALRLGVRVRAFGHADFVRQLGAARFAQQEQDDTAAYRTAIVRVAAEIGKAMP